jgi:hypothetical protein
MDPMFLIVLIGAVSFTLVALYQWAGKLGSSNDEMLAPRNWPRRVLSTAFAVGFWSIWFFHHFAA